LAYQSRLSGIIHTNIIAQLYRKCNNECSAAKTKFDTAIKEMRRKNFEDMYQQERLNSTSNSKIAISIELAKKKKIGKNLDFISFRDTFMVIKPK
jgi:hypothetical protein